MTLDTAHGRATKSQLFKVFGVTRQAVSKSLRTPVGEAKRQRRSSLPNSSPAELIKPAIVRITSEHLAWGVRKVWATLRREGFVVSQKRVYALMKSMGLTLEASPQRSRSTFGQVAVSEPNRRWGTDLTTVWTKLDGWVAVVPVLDYGDRYLLDIAVTKSQDSLAVLAPIQRALEEQFGKRQNVPHGLELRTDHGPQYTGADCEQLCWRWQLDHTYSPIGRPTGNSVAERFILTMKTELIWTQDWESVQELEAAIQAWRLIYNQQRPHQALRWQTPYERRYHNSTLAQVS